MIQQGKGNGSRDGTYSFRTITSPFHFTGEKRPLCVGTGIKGVVEDPCELE